MASIRSFAQRLLQECPEIHLLVNNAAVCGMCLDLLPLNTVPEFHFSGTSKQASFKPNLYIPWKVSNSDTILKNLYYSLKHHCPISTHPCCCGVPVLGLVTQSCLTLCDPMDCSPQARLPVELCRQEYWSCYHALLQGIFPNKGSNPGPLPCRGILYCLSHQGISIEPNISSPDSVCLRILTPSPTTYVFMSLRVPYNTYPRGP